MRKNRATNNDTLEKGQLQKLTSISTILRPDVLFSNLLTFDKHSKEEVVYIRSKLNEHFRTEILNTIGVKDISFALAKELQAIVSKMDYEKYKDSNLVTIISDHVLKEAVSRINNRNNNIKNRHNTRDKNSENNKIGNKLNKNKRENQKLLDELSEINESLQKRTPSSKVSDLLYLSVPLKENPVFVQDIREARITEYAKMANLTSNTAEKLAEKNLDMQDIDESALEDLVKEGTLNESQKKDLALNISLAKWSGDNLALVNSLKNNGIESPRDLARLKSKDLKEMISNENIPLPPHETPENYIESLFFSIERTFPSQVLFSRIIDPEFISKPLDSIDSLNVLLRNNDSLVAEGLGGEAPPVIDWIGIDEENRKAMEKDLQSLASLVNTYKYMGVAGIINNKEMSPDQKKGAITHRIRLVETFYKNNKEMDLRFVNFFDGNGDIPPGLSGENIPDSERPLVRNQLMAYQRLLTLADDQEGKSLLLSNGLDNAWTISDKAEYEFVSTMTATGTISETKASQIFANALEEVNYNAVNYAAIHDSLRGVFADVRMSNTQTQSLVNDLKRVDGFSDLFGSQSYCACSECRSILSPAAYFVDLMDVIDKNISKRFFSGSRYKDHPLHLRKRRGDLWDLELTCEITHMLIPYLTIVNEVLESYLKNNVITDGNVFETLNRESEKESFSLPFSLALEELRLYISHFDISLHDLYSLFRLPMEEVWREKINLSKGEFSIITIPDPDNVKHRFGNPSTFMDYPVQEFIRRAGISREQLGELLRIGFNPDIGRYISIAKKHLEGELQNFPEVLDGLTDTLSTYTHLDFIHRYLRLQKKLPWSILETDMVLTSLREADLVSARLDAGLVLQVAQLIHLQQKLKLDVEELCAMFSNIPATQDFPAISETSAEEGKERPLLLERLFDTEKLFDLDPESKSYTINSELRAGLAISDTGLLLLFKAFKDGLSFDDNDNYIPSKEGVSFLYRHTRLATALGLSIGDFVRVLRLLFGPGSAVENLDQIYRLLDFRDWLRSSPFDISELLFILEKEESDTVKYRTNMEQVTNLVLRIQQSPELAQLEGEGGEEERVAVMKKLLKESLANMFNLSSVQLKYALGWMTLSIDHPLIVTGLQTEFVPVEPREESEPEVLEPREESELRPILELVQELEWIVLIFDKLKFKEKITLDYIAKKHIEVFAIDDLKSLTLDDLRSLVAYRNLLSMGGNDEEDKTELFLQALLDKDIGEVNPSGMADYWMQDLILISSILEEITFPADYTRIQTINYFKEYLDVCTKLGLDGKSLLHMVNQSYQGTDYRKVISARDIALGAIGSKYDEKIRKDKLEPYQDKINVIKRDALCDYIIAKRQELKFMDLGDLYAFFLLDVNMSGCFRTSRLVNAISSLQLYVHRCLVNLEQSDPKLNPEIPDVKVEPSTRFAEQWEWLKNYRVWEASRKVNLFDENFILPELRDNKTPPFKQLEDELLQEKITKESAEAAYKKYVSEFAKLARLRIVGAYYHKEYDSVLAGLASALPYVSPGNGANRGSGKNSYYFFARTQQDPPEYYYRKWVEGKVWTPWKKIELTIKSDDFVSAVVHRGRLYLFWLELQTSEKKSVSDGQIDDARMDKVYTLNRKLGYSWLDENGIWSPSQKLDFNTDHDYSLPLNFSQKVWKEVKQKTNFGANGIVFPFVKDSWIYIIGAGAFRSEDSRPRELYARLDFFRNNLKGDVASEVISESHFIPYDKRILRFYEDGDSSTYLYDMPNPSTGIEAGIQWGLTALASSLPERYDYLTSNIALEDPDLNVVGYTSGRDYVLKLSDQQYLIQGIHPFLRDVAPSIPQRRLVGLSTSLADDLGETLFNRGLLPFLSLETQKLSEHPLEVDFVSPIKLAPPIEETEHIDFKGAYGTYYRELFFHIPFLIANHLNANQKFEEAKWWYERIFDPTATKDQDREPIKKVGMVMKIEVDHQEYIIGETVRLRGKYIVPPGGKVELQVIDPQGRTHPIGDTDPGEGLKYEFKFKANGKDLGLPGTYEARVTDFMGRHISVKFRVSTEHEHNWRYIEFRGLTVQKMKDILTDGEAIAAYQEDPFNPHAIARLRLNAYQKTIVMKYIDNLLDWGDHLFAQDTRESIVEATMLYVLASDILGERPIELGQCETAMGGKVVPTYKKIEEKGKYNGFLVSLENWVYNNTIEVSPFRQTSRRSGSAPILLGYEDSVDARERSSFDTSAMSRMPLYKVPLVPMVRQASMQVFCMPPNRDLLRYWDRVEDRLFKIRNCMNISGVRRQLALFQPPISPMALVRARAAGLSLEDILAALKKKVPPYRYSYLIEKAKQFTQTVQSFGSALLSALEKKDAEELTLLRSVHERNILRMTEEVKEQQLEEALRNFEANKEAKVNVQNRIDYYLELIDGGLTGWERTQQVSKHTATGFKIVEGGLHLLAGIYYLIPNSGSPFAMTYGGRELGASGVEFAQWTSSMAAVFDAIAASAGLEASFQRREKEWKQQLNIAEQEMRQTEQQLAAYEIRKIIAEEDLQIHRENMKQADELYDFYKGKFTNLGLYNYLSTTLNRLYRDSYNIAYDLAKMAEESYKFERYDNDAVFIANDNWDFGHAGLLAGERLMLQLQRMEKTHLESNLRNYEVTQAFSLALIKPEALMELKHTGSCEFTIPEIMFDLYYPGQYRRFIKSVRITIPAIAGPYTNVAAKLTLNESKVRKEPKIDDEDNLIKRELPVRPIIATSNAQNDAGLFELNFRDERYLPFEGAGAVESTWSLELPSVIRTFDYDTISDVIMQISYTAKDDSLFREDVEKQILDKLLAFSEDPGLSRMVSLKHEFPSVFYRLTHPSAEGEQKVEFEITRKHFPYFLVDKDLRLTPPVEIYLVPKGEGPIDTTALNFNIDSDIRVSEWNDWSTGFKKLKEGVATITGTPVRKWSVDTGTGVLNEENTDDVMILLRYKVQEE